MDRALDEIVSERQRGGGHRGRRGGRRNDFPRDGVRKSTREDSRNIDSEWVHDKFDNDTGNRPARAEKRYSPEPRYDSESAKLRVENLHYDLTKEDLEDLFERIGPVIRVDLTYDRAGRSDGIAYVTYESAQDAKRAIREFDGANAKGQPIRLVSIPGGPSGPRNGRRNPFDSAVAPARSLADRITAPPGRRSRSESPGRRSDVRGPTPSNVDRYVPGQNRRSRSPMPRRREGGRRPGARRERGGRAGGGERLAKDGRPKKTQEELDAEMEDYWGTKENGNGATTEVAAQDDIDMIE